MIKVNGESVDITPMTIEAYLKTTDFDTSRIAIERNEEFVPKSKYAETLLKDGDSLEIVTFVGGG